MKTVTGLMINISAIIMLMALGCQSADSPEKQGPARIKKYEPDWLSLSQHPTPQWLRDGKFGIYTHWGVYAVHAQGKNATWFSSRAYWRPGELQREYFEKTYGKLTRDFGYKDLIPMFTAEKFDAEEWADLFAKAGAKFAGPVAEHHDGFAMWDTEYSEWNAAKMGPKKDIVGELAEAIKEKDMKFVAAFHHAANWFFYPVFDERYDCNNPKYSGLYGPIHERDAEPGKEFHDEWYGKIIEVIDKYEPDLLWFDFALNLIREDYIKNFMAYYYNKAAADGKDVVITYKQNDLPPLAGLLDLELKQESKLTYHEWITDSSVDDQGAWGFVAVAGYKSVNRLVDNLIDRVSKNGYLLLNVGPKADGTIPEEAREKLLGMGEWLDVNGEAIYGTTSWTIAGEGPNMLDSDRRGDATFRESDVVYQPEDIRFTVKGDVLYAIALDWPGEECLITSFSGDRRFPYGWNPLYKNEIKEITMLGDDKPLEWEWVFGEWDEEAAIYTGRETGKYKGRGLLIKTPSEKPCEHAFVFKIVRKYEW